MQGNQEYMWMLRAETEKYVMEKLGLNELIYGSNEYFLFLNITKLIHEKRAYMGVTWEEMYNKRNTLIKLADEFLSCEI